MLNMAVKWGKMRESPFKGIKLFKENNGRMRIPSPEQEAAFFEPIRANPNAKRLRVVIATPL